MIASGIYRESGQPATCWFFDHYCRRRVGIIDFPFRRFVRRDGVVADDSFFLFITAVVRDVETPSAVHREARRPKFVRDLGEEFTCRTEDVNLAALATRNPQL